MRLAADQGTYPNLSHWHALCCGHGHCGSRALLFADVLLNLYYVLMNAYGWYYWLYGGQQSRQQAGELLPQRITVKAVLVLSCITLLGSVFMGYFFARYTKRTWPMPTVRPLWQASVAMWMSARKYLSSWIAGF